MAHPDLQSEHRPSQEDGRDSQARPAGLTALQRTKACFLKGVSYFSGDMEAFGKWMESESN